MGRVHVTRPRFNFEARPAVLRAHGPYGPMLQADSTKHRRDILLPAMKNGKDHFYLPHTHYSWKVSSRSVQIVTCIFHLISDSPNVCTIWP